MSAPRDTQLTALARISRQLKDLDAAGLDYIAAKVAAEREERKKGQVEGK